MAHPITDDYILKSQLNTTYFSDSPLWSSEYNVRNKQLNYIQQQGVAGPLRQQFVNFDLRKLDGQFIYAPDFTYVNGLTVQASTGTAFDSNTLIAVKNAITSLVSGIVIKINGTPVVTSDYLAYLSALNLLTKEDISFYDARGKEIMFVKDTQYNSVAQKVQTITVTDPASSTVVTSPPYTEALDVTTANKGFTERATMMSAYLVSSTGGVLTFVFAIPLKYVSSLINAWREPITNTGMEVQVNHSFNQDSLQPWPIMTESTSSLATVNIDSSYLGGARLYYQRYEFFADTTALINQKLSEGWKYSIDFESVIDLKNPFNNTSQTAFNVLASDKVYRMTSVIAVFPQPGQLRSQYLPDIWYNNTKLSSAQVSINGTPYYDLNPTTDHEFYNLFLQRYQGQQAFDGSMCLTKDEWLRKARVYCFPINRIKDVKNMISSGYSIGFTASRADATPVDCYIMTFGIQSLDLTLSFNTCKAELRDAALPSDV